MKEFEEMKKLRKEMEDKLQEERSELEYSKFINLALFRKERQSNDENQEARKELIKGLKDLSGDGATIRVKVMGEVDDKPLMKACEQRFSGENVVLEHAKLCSEVQNALKDPAWHPFKRVVIGEEEVIDEEDEKLKNLSHEWGEDVKNAVKTALEELHEFNGRGRYAISVMWNVEQGREARVLPEGIVALMAQQVKHP
ncbi:unnamed protein product [Thlaspi arvense]|uniref:Factor of DNA methylation 1-5/IDN2 domain-containing protein n=1 Tax=Thlaspi arvense TaxID=13288 RepID=A0AAU9SPB2_THLAR|nr:unnamed protein product [Thlaspi arvense]